MNEIGALTVANIDEINSAMKGDGGTTTKMSTVPDEPLRDGKRRKGCVVVKGWVEGKTADGRKEQKKS